MKKQSLFLTITFVLFCFSNLFAEEKLTVVGTILDSRNESVIGATVQEKGNPGNVVIADLDGKFSIVVPPTAVLMINSLSYQTVEVSVNGKAVLSIQMHDDLESLDELVVTGYGGTQLRSKLTNSIANVKEEHFSVGLFSNPAQALSGAVSGLRVIQSSGNPNSAPSIILRGGTNLDGSGSPLIIIDGMQRDDLSGLNPEDVESMEVLKDAGATALYGARANNGVVLVRTKKGKDGKATISFKAKVGLNYFNNPYELLDARDYLTYMRTSFQRSSNIFQTSDGKWVGTNNMSSLKAANSYGTGNIYWADDARTIPADGLSDARAVYSPMIYSPDLEFLLGQGWETMTDPVYGDEIIFKNWDQAAANIESPALSQDYNLNVSGGNDKGSYYAGIGYNHTEGLPLENFYERLSITFNGDYKIKKWLTSSTNFSLFNSKYNGLPNGRANTPAFEDHYFTSMMTAPPTMRGYNPDGELLLGRNVQVGSMGVNVDKFIRENNTDVMNIGQAFDFQIYKDLSLKLSAMWMYDDKMNESFDKDHRTNSSGSWNRARNSSAYYAKKHKQTYNAVLNYNKVFALDHSFSALGGFEYYDEYLKGFSAGGSGAPTDDFSDLGLTDPGENKRTIDSWHERQRIMSFFGRVNYDYKGKYLLSATVRHDGYSILLGDNRWGTFPGVSAGWVLSNEDFFSGLGNVISFAKLRASYGLNGNVSNISGENIANGAYDLQGSFTTGLYGGDVGYLLDKLPNPMLRWEKSRTVDVGLDLSFLENRINANFTFYNRVTESKYADIPIPGSSGATTFRSNNGEISNTGLEIDLGFRVIRTSDWNWDINVNVAYNKNKILKLPNNGLEKNRQNAFQVYDPNTGNLMWTGGYQEGMEPGILYSFQADGIYNSYEEIPGNLVDKSTGNNGSNGLLLYGPDAWAAMSDSDKVKADGKAAALPIQPGDVKWRDVNGDGVIDNFDMVEMGNTTPRWVGGINTNLTYKSFTLSARFDYALDYVIADGRTPWIMGNMVGLFNSVEETKDTWSTDNPNGKYPKYSWADQLEKRNYARNSSMFVYDGSYLSLKELSLSYSLPQTILDKINVQDLALTITGQNLGYLTAAKNVFSPEKSAGATNYPTNGGYPLPRTIIFGISLTF